MNEKTMIENMIRWAKDRLGETGYAGWCLSFIEDALEISNGIEIFGGDSAKGSAVLYADAMRQDEPERGAFVFYDCLCPSRDGPVNWGHCGISLGDGTVIHAWDKVRIDNYLDIGHMTALTGDHPHYIGWVPVRRVLSQKPGSKYYDQAVACVKDYVLPAQMKLYHSCDGNLDRVYGGAMNGNGYFGKVIEPGHIYELGYEKCTCPKVLSGEVTDPEQCECSRQSILFILNNMEPDSRFEVEILETVLRGAEHCRFRIRRN